MEAVEKTAELVSLLLAVPTIYFAALVLFHWSVESYRAWKAVNRDASQWFLMGVEIGFIGSVLDNIYWSVAWSAMFVGHPSAWKLLAYGAFSSIFTRQIAGVYAAYCHVRAFYETEGRSDKLNFHFTVSVVLGLAYAVTLVWIRMHWDFSV